MLKNNMKKIIISLMTIIFIISATNMVLATDQKQDLTNWFEDLEHGKGNVSGDEGVEQIPEGTNANTNNNSVLNTNTNTNTNTNVNENRPTTTPHAGLEDYTGLIFVAVFAVSAVYAYKKVKEYNA